jgi:phosphoglycolate phosphatase-like HAD superfamily hydrolase
MFGGMAVVRRAGSGLRVSSAIRPRLERGFASGKTMPSMSSMGIKLVVCDMAGTTVEEYGIVYKTLREAMIAHGLSVTEAEMHPWHGAAKGAVTKNFLDREPDKKVDAKEIDATFEMMVAEAYSKAGATDLICPALPAWVSKCQSADIKVGLNTGYPVIIQDKLLADLGLDRMVVRVLCPGHSKLLTVASRSPTCVARDASAVPFPACPTGPR